jgi:bacillithiol biosynthesis cysteine-adding enzyme BshC
LELVMESACIRHSDLPHTTRLFSDYLYRFDRVERFYAHNPHDPESFRRAASALEFPAGRRAALVAALAAQNPVGEPLERLAREGTVAVITGQQVGLFSGPCYTIYKALTAARLARQLTASGVPAVPVFWLATEDHDFEEVNHCWVFDARSQPVKLALAGGNSARRPVGGIAIDRAPLDELRRAIGDLPFGEEVAALVEAAYAPGRTMGEAFAALVGRVLESEGLLFFDPMHPASRQLAAPMLAETVRNGADLSRALLERERELTAAGYHAQVHFEAQTSLVFLLENGKRLALRRDGQQYAADGRRFSAADLAARAEHLSPNALLRPVVQDSMFPTVAYVGGPAELAYFAQSQVLYQQLAAERMPVAVSRQGATLVDARAAKLLDRYGLAVPDVFAPVETVREKLARKLVPGNVSGALEAVRAETAAPFDRLAGALAAFDPTLAEAFARSRRKIEYQLAKTGRKAEREALRRDERAASEAAYLSGLLYPEKHLQERLYSIVPFLARHGMDLISTIGEQLAPECCDHRVLLV